MKKDFTLWLGCLGNGLTVSNSAKEINEDYEHIAHISNGGNISWYVKPESIPGKALLRIEHESDTMRANFTADWQKRNSSSKMETILDSLPLDMFLKRVRHEITFEECEKYYLDHIA